MIEIPNIYDEFKKLVSQIPEGMITTYGDIALALGDVIASRAVGEMLSENDDPINIPCHRVVKTDGSIGGFTHPNGVKEKLKRLEAEGIKVSNGKIDNFEKIRFRDFRTDFPLSKFRDSLKIIKNDEELINKLDFSEINIIDVSYINRIGIGAAYDYVDGKIEFKIKPIKSPYIPNYLFLREGEIILYLIRNDKINIIDGNGMIHRDKRGLATVAGYLKNSVTIGVAKKLLTGDLTGRTIYIEGEPVGLISNKSYISIGFGLGFPQLVYFEKFLRSEITYDPITKIPDIFSRRYRDAILSN